MKKLYFISIAFLTAMTLNAQIIDIPDADFKNALLNTNCVDTVSDGFGDADADINDDGEISISEAEAVIGLIIHNQSISSLDGIEYFVNLTNLRCTSNQLTSLNVSSLVNITNLNCSNNQLTEIIGLGNLSNLAAISCQSNQLTQLDLSGTTSMSWIECSSNLLNSLIIGQQPDLEFLDCGYNLLTNIDLSGAQYALDIFVYDNLLTYLDLSDRIAFGYTRAQNNQIETLILKNGMPDIFPEMDLSGYEEYFDFTNNPISYVCADYEELDALEEMFEFQNINDYAISTYCSFEPGGEFFTIEGNTQLDLNNNGCDAGDSGFSNLSYTIISDSETFSYIVNNSGDFTIPILEGSHTITPTLENSDYYSVSPIGITVDFPTDDSPYLQDFCVTPNGEYNDLEVTLIPLDEARPGFDSTYKIVYKNKGSTVLSGSVDLIFQDDIMDIISSFPTEDSQSGNTLTWNFTDLNPFETRAILVTMNINTPTETPPVNGDDVLVFDMSVNSSETDETPDDNNFTLNQTVVNSFDPNDKTCLEGDVISPDMVGEFVHYRIRFENTGTANAINVVIKDHIDRTKYDLSTLVPIDASHEFVARIKDDGDDYYVEFIFENINLPFDDANNDGYVVFKIKTLDTLELNDVIENEAEIYFDFNFPIITNVAETTVSTLSTDDFELADNAITLFPNPTQNTLYLKSELAIKDLIIYDIAGRRIQELANLGSETTMEIDTKALQAGTYFIEIKTEDAEIVKAFIKN